MTTDRLGLISLGVPWVINNFAVDHAGFRSVTVDLMAKTVPITQEEYAKIDCRVGIIHYIGEFLSRSVQDPKLMIQAM